MPQVTIYPSALTDFVNGSTPRTYTIFTVPDGYTLVLDRIDVITVSEINPGTEPTIIVGNTLDDDEYEPTHQFGTYCGIPEVDPPNQTAPEGTVITFTITANSTASAQSGIVCINGYLIPSSGVVIDSPLGSDLVSLNYVKQAQSIHVCTYDCLLSTLISAASQAVKDWTLNDFTDTTYNEYYNVARSTLQLALNHYPIIAINSVTLMPYSLTPIVVSGANVIPTSSGIIAFNESTTSGYCFPQGFQSVLVNYEAGWASIPSDVQQVTAMIVQRLFFASQKDTTLDGERLGDYNYKVRADAYELINGDIAKTLAKYQRYLI